MHSWKENGILKGNRYFLRWNILWTSLLELCSKLFQNVLCAIVGEKSDFIFISRKQLIYFLFKCVLTNCVGKMCRATQVEILCHRMRQRLLLKNSGKILDRYAINSQKYFHVRGTPFQRKRLKDIMLKKSVNEVFLTICSSFS